MTTTARSALLSILVLLSAAGCGARSHATRRTYLTGGSLSLDVRVSAPIPKNMKLPASVAVEGSYVDPKDGKLVEFREPCAQEGQTLICTIHARSMKITWRFVDGDLSSSNEALCPVDTTSRFLQASGVTPLFRDIMSRNNVPVQINWAPGDSRGCDFVTSVNIPKS